MFKNIITMVTIVLLGVMIITPYGPAHVISESMEPEIQAGSTIFIIPAATVMPGDVIVFRPVKLYRELIVHRVLQETPEGLITGGDAVDRTDQERGEPLVTADRVVGKAFALNGRVVQVGYRTFVYLVLGICLVWIFFWGSAQLTMRIKRLRVKHVQLFAILFCTILIVFTMILGSGGRTISYLASERPGTRANHIQVGGTGEIIFSGRNRSLIPTLVYLESPAGRTVKMVPPFAAFETSVTIKAPEQPGWYEVVIHRFNYPVVMPAALIDYFYRFSPYLAMLAVIAMMVFIINLILRIVEPWIPLSLLGGKLLTRKFRRLKRSFMV